MATYNSADDSNIIATLLSDVTTLLGGELDSRFKRLTYRKVCKRLDREGMSFLTKTLPRLCKGFDKTLAGGAPFNCIEHRFAPMPGTQLPRFLGELFERVLQRDGTVSLNPCISSIKAIRQFCYLFYKYELPYSHETEQEVLLRFKRTEEELYEHDHKFESIARYHESIVAQTQQSLGSHSESCDYPCPSCTCGVGSSFSPEMGRALSQCVGSTYPRHLERFVGRTHGRLIHRAQRLLERVFTGFDPLDIIPRHGPGAVSNQKRLYGKYYWDNIPERLASVFPVDAYFYASTGHVCDRLSEINSLGDNETPAKVVLVPKDSRGPRIISEEPHYQMWIQQGLMSRIVDWVERHPLTRYNVHFTDQRPNQLGALLGSETGKYATLDLNEASDRVSLGLVRLLFPKHVFTCLEAARSLTTVLPNGEELKLRKFAPMGSALCFPVLALTIWSLLTAAMPDADARESILVYGDDVIVDTAQAGYAMSILEAYGLKVNRDKSCTSGFFRESCGIEAYKGVDVTPLRLRTVWSESPSPNVYASWIAYANQFADRRYWNLYDTIVERILRVYRRIPEVRYGEDWKSSPYPALVSVPEHHSHFRRRVNHKLQTCEWLVPVVVPKLVKKEIDGWKMLLRFLTEGQSYSQSTLTQRRPNWVDMGGISHPFSVRVYTKRGAEKLALRWR